jgi:hypothetical protein
MPIRATARSSAILFLTASLARSSCAALAHGRHRLRAQEPPLLASRWPSPTPFTPVCDRLIVGFPAAHQVAPDDRLRRLASRGLRRAAGRYSSAPPQKLAARAGRAAPHRRLVPVVISRHVRTEAGRLMDPPRALRRAFAAAPGVCSGPTRRRGEAPPEVNLLELGTNARHAVARLVISSRRPDPPRRRGDPRGASRGCAFAADDRLEVVGTEVTLEAGRAARAPAADVPSRI